MLWLVVFSANRQQTTSISPSRGMKEPLPDTAYGNLVTRVSVFLNIVYIAVNEIDRIFQSFFNRATKTQKIQQDEQTS